jgi:formate-dependent nitrite reductase cytochrome c552 subunit
MPQAGLSATLQDAPASVKPPPAVLDQWAHTAHAQNGINCTDCHAANVEGRRAWTDRPGYQSCASCHKSEAGGFLGGKHGMRLAGGLPAMSPANARLPMAGSAASRTLGCNSCHSDHEFDTRRAAADACLECHADRHSLAYKSSPHFALWRAETNGGAAVGSGVSCATCHLPRLVSEENGAEVVRVQHNQNANLRPNEKMIREVCMNCHGLGFSIDALADSALIEANFRGRPARHIDSIEMAARKARR